MTELTTAEIRLEHERYIERCAAFQEGLSEKHEHRGILLDRLEAAEEMLERHILDHFKEKKHASAALRY